MEECQTELKVMQEEMEKLILNGGVTVPGVPGEGDGDTPPTPHPHLFPSLSFPSRWVKWVAEAYLRQRKQEAAVAKYLGIIFFVL